jgi:hypothetical protein
MGENVCILNVYQSFVKDKPDIQISDKKLHILTKYHKVYNLFMGEYKSHHTNRPKKTTTLKTDSFVKATVRSIYSYFIS